MERLKSLYSKYNFDFTDDDIRKDVEEIIKNNFDKYNTPEVYAQCLNMIDLTSLTERDTDDKIGKMMERVNQFNATFPELKNVAAVCVYPALVPAARATLEVEGVNIASVCACFPSSQTFIEAKIAETGLTVAAGANEIDIVISLGKFLSGFHSEVYDEIREIKDACHGAHLKVILESGLLPDAKSVKQASLLAMAAGADFIKTSTGKTEVSATLTAAYVMCQAIKEYYAATGIKVGFKPAGGIRTTREAVEYYTIVRTVLGEEWINNKLFRFGATSLANSLLTSIKGEEVKYF